MSDLLEVYSQKYDDKIILGVFNLKLNIQSLKAFIDKQNFRFTWENARASRWLQTKTVEKLTKLL